MARLPSTSDLAPNSTIPNLPCAVRPPIHKAKKKVLSLCWQVIWMRRIKQRAPFIHFHPHSNRSHFSSTDLRFYASCRKVVRVTQKWDNKPRNLEKCRNSHSLTFMGQSSSNAVAGASIDLYADSNSTPRMTFEMNPFINWIFILEMSLWNECLWP